MGIEQGRRVTPPGKSTVSHTIVKVETKNFLLAVALIRRRSRWKFKPPTITPLLDWIKNRDHWDVWDWSGAVAFAVIVLCICAYPALWWYTRGNLTINEHGILDTALSMDWWQKGYLSSARHAGFKKATNPPGYCCGRYGNAEILSYEAIHAVAVDSGHTWLLGWLENVHPICFEWPYSKQELTRLSHRVINGKFIIYDHMEVVGGKWTPVGGVDHYNEVPDWVKHFDGKRCFRTPGDATGVEEPTFETSDGGRYYAFGRVSEWDKDFDFNAPSPPPAQRWQGDRALVMWLTGNLLYDEGAPISANQRALIERRRAEFLNVVSGPFDFTDWTVEKFGVPYFTVVFTIMGLAGLWVLYWPAKLLFFLLFGSVLQWQGQVEEYQRSIEMDFSRLRTVKDGASNDELRKKGYIK
jgi:hypothetical protein